MTNRSGLSPDVQHSTSTIPVATQIGPRVAGTVYYDGPRLVEVREVVLDPSEARCVLRRHSARFAVLVRDLHAGTEHYTGAIWTGSDRVLKAVAA
jgi:hypothetical protein